MSFGAANVRVAANAVRAPSVVVRGRLVPYLEPGVLDGCSEHVVAAHARMFEADARAYEAELALERVRAELEVARENTRAAEENTRAAAEGTRAAALRAKAVESEARIAESEVRIAELNSVAAGSPAPSSRSAAPASGVGCVSRASGVRSWRRGVVTRAESQKSWRSGPAGSASGFSTEGGAESATEPKCNNGRCYAALAVAGGRSTLTRQCGKWPTVSRLLALPAAVVSMPKLSSYVLVRSVGNDWHVAPAEDYPPATATVSDVLGRMVREFDDLLEVGDSRWEGTLLQAVRDRPEPLGTFPLPDLTSRVGGSRLARWVSWPASPRSKRVLYLGGTREGRKVAGWRERLLDILGPVEGVECVSPELTAGLTVEEVEDAVDWESKNMALASVAVVFFGSCYRLDAGFRELEHLLTSGRVVVCCPLGVSCRERVVDVCSSMGVEVCGSLEAVAVRVAQRFSACAEYSGSWPVGVGLGVGPDCAERLDWDQVRGRIVVSGYEREVLGSRVLVASFRSSRRVVGGIEYGFTVPGEMGVARWKCSEGLHVLGEVLVENGYFILRCGAECVFRLDYSLSSFSPTFEYPCGFARTGVLFDASKDALLG